MEFHLKLRKSFLSVVRSRKVMELSSLDEKLIGHSPEQPALTDPALSQRLGMGVSWTSAIRSC